MQNIGIFTLLQCFLNTANHFLPSICISRHTKPSYWNINGLQLIWRDLFINKPYQIILTKCKGINCFVTYFFLPESLSVSYFATTYKKDSDSAKWLILLKVLSHTSTGYCLLLLWDCSAFLWDNYFRDN